VTCQTPQQPQNLRTAQAARRFEIAIETLDFDRTLWLRPQISSRCSCSGFAAEALLQVEMISSPAVGGILSRGRFGVAPFLRHHQPRNMQYESGNFMNPVIG
jgi:hypothetical protein